jgi:hypothetical protein
VFARCLSSLKDERVNASKQLKGPNVKFTGDKQKLIDQISHVGFIIFLPDFSFQGNLSIFFLSGIIRFEDYLVRPGLHVVPRSR